MFDQAPENVTYLYNVLLSGYVKLGFDNEAWELFKQIPNPDVASWTTMISCFSRTRDMDRARALFEVMPEPCTEAYTALIGGYLQLGDVKNAQKTFEEMPHRDFVAWNLMINGYVKNGLSNEALALVCQMPRKDTRTWNSILQGYVQEGDMEKALICFNKIPQKDITSWNIMISGYHSEESLHLLARMTREGFVPDQGSFTIVISICGFLAFLAYGRAMHSFSVKCGCDQDVKVASSLIAMYSKCGLAEEASEIFDRMPRRDTIAWNARLLAQTYHGTAAETFDLFQTRYQPDHVTFLSMLSTCAHNGLVDEGLNLFASMLREWKLAPQSEHYTCIVDLFGRSGRLTEAYKVLKQLPAELSMDACESLLSACRVHGNLEMAEVVANRLLGSKPPDGGLYVLLANIYTAKGMWENAAKTRFNMKVQCPQKEQSCSWIEIEGKRIAFLSSDRSHSQIAELYSLLQTIIYVRKRYNRR